MSADHGNQFWSGEWRDGRFPFDRLISEYPLEELETALEDFHASTVIKPVLIPATSSY